MPSQSPLAKQEEHAGHSCMCQNVLLGDTAMPADGLYSSKAAHMERVESTLILWRVHSPGINAVKESAEFKYIRPTCV